MNSPTVEEVVARIPLDVCMQPTKVKVKVRDKVRLWPIVSRPGYLAVRTPSGTRDQFSPFCIANCRFLDVGRSLSREDGSAIYCTVASGPCQSSHSRVQVQQHSRLYFIVSFETTPTPTWRARSSYLNPTGTGWPSYTPGRSIGIVHSRTKTTELVCFWRFFCDNNRCPGRDVRREPPK
jgi:endogenous inhibitor of DNA gyrase (YacG/DUF329 family)